MKSIRYALLLSGLLIAGSGSAQHTYKRKNMSLVNMNQYKLSGWHLAPGVSYPFSRFVNREQELYNANDTVYNATFDPGGRIGLYLEAGRYHIFKYGYLFNYMDYSLAFKQIRGKESFTGTMMQESSSTTIMNTEGNSRYGHHYLTGNINLNNIWQLNDLEFIQQSIGFNLDYRIIHRQQASGNVAFQDPQTPARFLAQLHYKIGYGIKWTDRFFVIPSLETPILSFVTWDNGRSSYNVFSSRYRPVYLTIRFAWLRKRTNDCPPVDINPEDARKQKQYQQQQ
jgi:hypothetical protein